MQPGWLRAHQGAVLPCRLHVCSSLDRVASPAALLTPLTPKPNPCQLAGAARLLVQVQSLSTRNETCHTGPHLPAKAPRSLFSAGSLKLKVMEVNRSYLVPHLYEPGRTVKPI